VSSELQQEIKMAAAALQQGQLIAYPTESVFGLGCDPQNIQAVENLIKLKQRNPDKGLILIASSFEQLLPYIDSIDEALENHAKATWPGPVTWVWPKKNDTGGLSLIIGKHSSIAVRVTAHPTAVALCEAFQGAIVSTSANLEGEAPAKTAQQVEKIFPNQLNKIIHEDVGDLLQPTVIYDVITKVEIRN